MYSNSIIKLLSKGTLSGGDCYPNLLAISFIIIHYTVGWADFFYLNWIEIRTWMCFFPLYTVKFSTKPTFSFLWNLEATQLGMFGAPTNNVWSKRNLIWTCEDFFEDKILILKQLGLNLLEISPFLQSGTCMFALLPSFRIFIMWVQCMQSL